MRWVAGPHGFDGSSDVIDQLCATADEAVTRADVRDDSAPVVICCDELSRLRWSIPEQNMGCPLGVTVWNASEHCDVTP